MASSTVFRVSSKKMGLTICIARHTRLLIYSLGRGMPRVPVRFYALARASLECYHIHGGYLSYLSVARRVTSRLRCCILKSQDQNLTDDTILLLYHCHHKEDSKRRLIGTPLRAKDQAVLRPFLSENITYLVVFHWRSPIYAPSLMDLYSILLISTFDIRSMRVFTRFTILYVFFSSSSAFSRVICTISVIDSPFFSQQVNQP